MLIEEEQTPYVKAAPYTPKAKEIEATLAADAADEAAKPPSMMYNMKTADVYVLPIQVPKPTPVMLPTKS